MRYWILALALFLLFPFFSCKSTPSSPPEKPAANTGEDITPEAIPPDSPDVFEEKAPSDSDIPPEILEEPPEISPGISAGVPGETSVEQEPELPEPWPLISLPPEVPVLPEESFPLDVPREPQIPIPEPPAVIEDSSPPEPSPQTQVPEPQPVPPTPPPSEAPRQPPPPPFLGSSEPEIRPPVRQPVPMPVNPLPDLPARPVTQGDEIVFSRIVRATVGQLIEIPFRGTGWVYLGELGNRRGLGYDSRRLDTGSAGSVEGQSFIFRAEAPGTYIQKFYKQDFIQDYIINDHVQVIIGDENPFAETGRIPFDRGRVIAEPRWPPVPQPPVPSAQLPPAAQQPAEASPVSQDSVPLAVPSSVAVPSAAVETVPSQAQSLPPEIPIVSGQDSADDGIAAVTPPVAASPAPAISPDGPAEFVRQAQQEFNAGRVEAALVTLDAMRQRFPSGSDEAWWLYGQLLEANSPGRDIRLALEYYRRIIREYPQSNRASEAQQRIAYLERYYFNIR